MDEWRKVRLGDVCHTNTDSYSKKDKWDFVNYLDTGNITANCIDEIQHIDILNEKLPSRAKRKVKYNSIIYSTVRPNQRHYGIIKSQPENFLVSTGFAVIDVDSNNVDADFLYFLLSSDYVTEKLHAIAEQSVSAYPSIKASDIEDLEISLPPLTVQRKISSLLMSIEDKIAQNVAINKNLEKQVQAIFKANFIENDNVSTLPQIPLADLCKVVTKGTTPTTLGKPFTDRGINFIRAESILDRHTIDTTKFAFIDYETHAMLKRSIILHGDILFTIAGTLGRFALIDDSMLPANTNQAVAIIRADEKKVAPEYVYSFFIGNWHNDYYTKRIQQAVQANLSLTTIKSLPIPVLQGTSMEEYLNVISPIIAMSKQNELENRHLANLRDTLLPRLMYGEINVSNLEI